jgi:acetyl-CoA carboxylase biotin carboxyl carrier protein
VFDVKQVRELIELMVEHDLSEIRIRQGDASISLRKGPSGEVALHPVMTAPLYPPQHVHPAANLASAQGAPAEAADEHAGLVPILSPMVGTYYSASDPDSPPFVKVGMDVTPDTPVCIIEAMKVFNEIKAEVSGTIERILVQNDQAVEFGQPLMMVRPKS